MLITFLGTSHGVPAADRYCSCTMIDVGGRLYFIDAGAPLIDILLRRGVDLSAVKTIFTTHIHGDHVNGLPALTDLFNWYFKETSVDIYLTEQRGIDAIRGYLSVVEGPLDEQRLRYHVMTPSTVYDDGVIRVTPFPTRHMGDRPAFSYLVEAEGKKVMFSGDLSPRLTGDDFPAYTLGSEVDLLVCEMAHFGVSEVTPWLERCQAKKVLFNHVFPLDKLDQIRALDGKWGYPIRPVDDGEQIAL